MRALTHDVEGLSSQLARFDAGQAMCFDPHDQHWLLGVIESSFGALPPFNNIVRHMFACLEETSVAERSVMVAERSMRIKKHEAVSV